MTWEWSHSIEGLEFAREYLETKVGIEILSEIAAEWDTHARSEADEDAPEFDQEFFKERSRFHLALPSDIVAAYIWERMEVLRSCDNGGHKLWACPYGCRSHKVPVGEDDE